jgi:hypothetical protein
MPKPNSRMIGLRRNRVTGSGRASTKSPAKRISATENRSVGVQNSHARAR